MMYSSPLARAQNRTQSLGRNTDSATIWTHSYITALMMGTEMVPETFVVFNELTHLIVREDFINVKVVEVVSFIYKV
jgi:hypothetical protein